MKISKSRFFYFISRYCSPPPSEHLTIGILQRYEDSLSNQKEKIRRIDNLPSGQFTEWTIRLMDDSPNGRFYHKDTENTSGHPLHDSPAISAPRLLRSGVTNFGLQRSEIAVLMFSKQREGRETLRRAKQCACRHAQRCAGYALEVGIKKGERRGYVTSLLTFCAFDARLPRICFLFDTSSTSAASFSGRWSPKAIGTKLHGVS